MIERKKKHFPFLFQFANLRFGSDRNVNLLNGHYRLIQMVMDREFEALAGLQMVGIIKSLGVQKDAKAVGFSHLTSGS